MTTPRHPLPRLTAAALACAAALTCTGQAVAGAAPDGSSDGLMSSLSSSNGSSGADAPLTAPERPTAQPATIRIGTETIHQPGPHETWALQNVPGTEYAEAHSPAMGVHVPLLIARPKDPAARADAPTIYLLNGLDAGTGWFAHTDAVDFYTSRGVNVVMPTTGAYTFYTDWIDGPNQWDTFLARELPGAIESRLGANGKRAVMGVSMSAVPALTLAQNNPGTWDGIASISGCASTTSVLGRSVAAQVFDSSPEPITFEQVWGAPEGEYARMWDPMLNLNKLSPEFQGKPLEIFISSTSGLAGMESLTTGNKIFPGDINAAYDFVTVGGPIDVGANICTHVLDQRMTMRGIAHDVRFYPQGTHNWNSFAWAIADSWPTLSRALGK